MRTRGGATDGKVVVHLPAGGSAPDGKSGRYAACRASGSADSEAKADVITRVASQSVILHDIALVPARVHVLMALTRDPMQQVGVLQLALLIR